MNDDRSTILKWLEDAGFDWSTGIVVVQETEGDANGWPGWDSKVKVARYATKDDPLLSREFYAGYGAPECPCFWAKDKDAVYFPVQYDGATSICKVDLLPTRYLNGEPTPYPGG